MRIRPVMKLINHSIAALLPVMPKRLVWMFSRRYIAGTTSADAERVARRLNAEGCEVTVDLLGEFVGELGQAVGYCDQYLELISHMEAAGIRGNYSLKPTMFGLCLDEGACFEMVRRVVAEAAKAGNFVRIDMEDSSCVDGEIRLFRRLKKRYPRNVGLVLQCHLRRTASDLESLLDLHSTGCPLNLRLCKGIYVESPEVAYQEREEIRERFVADLEFMFRHGIHVGIATHDQAVVERAVKLIDRYRVGRDGYEFQMLHGVRPGLRRSLVADGHRMRVYVPFGRDWFAYSTRRLKENPNIAGDIVKGIFVRG